MNGMPLRPDWAQKVTELRKSLGLKQIEFAAKFAVTQAAVSRWETGVKEPSAENYIRMGNMASEPECFWFWKRAGLDLTKMRAIPEGKKR
jgi:transcriptional regulator with XRE-family HTH domain